MTRIDGARLDIQGWAGGVREDIEPRAWSRGAGVLDDALNIVPVGGDRLAVRGGSRVQLAFALNGISQVLGVFPFSPVGAVAIAFSAANDRHYAYALTDTLTFALPNGSPTESGSSVSLGSGWETAAPGRPQAVELFETLYVIDTATANRRPMVTIKLVGSALVCTTPTYNLDGIPGNDAPMRPGVISAFNSHIFIGGYDSEAANLAPHMVRHSFLGRDPSNVDGFDPDAYSIFGAQGQPVRAMCPGNTILLAAKENELYRITGSGRGVEGWQFPYAQLNNSQGFGVTNPYALAQYNGTWYGVGRAGPFRTDGSSVDGLLGEKRERARSWARVGALETAFVLAHPDRQLILFGFHQSGSPQRPTLPFVLWTWDVERERWQAAQQYPRTFHFVGAIPTATGGGPSQQPSAPVQLLTRGNYAFDSVTCTFSAGDLTATTEVWAREANGISYLVQTLPAGIQRFTIPAPVSKRLFVRLRHAKGITTGEFTGEVPCYTRILAPQVKAGANVNNGAVRADFLTYVEGTDLNVFDTSGRELIYPARTAGFTTEFNLPNDACVTFIAPDQGAAYGATSVHPEWPLGYEESEVAECHTLSHKCTPTPIANLAPDPRQRTEQGGMQFTSIAVTFFPAWQGESYRVEYRLNGAPDWIAGPVVATTLVDPLDLVEVTLSGLNPSTSYEVSVVNVRTGARSASFVMFTKLAAPTMTAATAGGPGSPVVNLTVTMPRASLTLVLSNALGTYEATYVDAAVGPVTYQSTIGVCGSPDRYYARAQDVAWPEPFQYSEAVAVDVINPCVVG